jgi:hypothetical protein
MVCAGQLLLDRDRHAYVLQQAALDNPVLPVLVRSANTRTSAEQGAVLVDMAAHFLTALTGASAAAYLFERGTLVNLARGPVVGKLPLWPCDLCFEVTVTRDALAHPLEAERVICDMLIENAATDLDWAVLSCANGKVGLEPRGLRHNIAPIDIDEPPPHIDAGYDARLAELLSAARRLQIFETRYAELADVCATVRIARGQLANRVAAERQAQEQATRRTDDDRMARDLGKLRSAFGSRADHLIYIVGSQQADAVTRSTLFPSSVRVAPLADSVVIAVVPDAVVAGVGTPRVEAVRKPGTFSTACLRLVVPLAWTLRSADALAWIKDVQWGRA